MTDGNRQFLDFWRGVGQNAAWDLIKWGALLPAAGGSAFAGWHVDGVFGAVLGGAAGVLAVSLLLYVVFKATARFRSPPSVETNHFPGPNQDLEDQARRESSASFRAAGATRLREDVDDLMIALLEEPSRTGLVVPVTSSNPRKYVQVGDKAFTAKSDDALADRFLFAQEELIMSGDAEWTSPRQQAFRLMGRGAIAAREVKSRREKDRASAHRLIETMRNRPPNSYSSSPFTTHHPPVPSRSPTEMAQDQLLLDIASSDDRIDVDLVQDDITRIVVGRNAVSVGDPGFKERVTAFRELTDLGCLKQDEVNIHWDIPSRTVTLRLSDKGTHEVAKLKARMSTQGPLRN